jgi:maleylpyruvate isomerase
MRYGAAMGGVLRLYAYSHSSMSWAVRMGLAYKDVAHETVAVDISRGSDARERGGYHAINAFGQVPVLEWQHDGQLRRSAQSFAILELLDELYPSPPLLPADRFLRARCRELAGMIQSGIQPLQNNYTLAQIAARGADELEWARHFIGRGLQALERAAAETAGQFLIGDTPSLADLYLGPQLFNARRRGAPLDGVPRLLAIEQNLSARDFYQRTHPDRCT